MPYLEEYNLLKSIYNYDTVEIEIPNEDVIIRNFDFHSQGNEFYPDDEHFLNLVKPNSLKIKTAAAEEVSDAYLDFAGVNPVNFDVNVNFRYPAYFTKDGKKTGSAIILFHGLNESSWDKYHPWALELVRRTGQAVIMFPIAFHINRRPENWSLSRKMNELSKERRHIYPNVKESSFVNAAISMRLQMIPELFFWSGLRTFNDVLKLIDEVRGGKFDFIDKDARINFFGYSIGAFLTEHILFIEREKFERSRAVLFCGGATMDLMYPSSRYIYDEETAKSMTDFYVQDFEKKIKGNVYLEKFFERDTRDAMTFRSMLNINTLSDYRTERISEIKERIYALPLTKDEVIPPRSVRKTLEAGGVNVDEMDCGIDYDHISPFPLSANVKEETDRFFCSIFEKASSFLGK